MASATSALIVVDGSHGEGGGALLRTALAMSALTQQAMRLEHIRTGTKFPGLDAEDLTLANALGGICRADVVGMELGSTSLSFMPTSRPRGINGDIQSFRSPSGRGANCLIVLNALLPVLARTGVFSSVKLVGETFGHNSLSYDYFAGVTLVALRRLGLYAEPDLLLPGFGRESEGEVGLDVEPSALSALDWSERGSLRSMLAVV